MLLIVVVTVTELRNIVRGVVQVRCVTHESVVQGVTHNNGLAVDVATVHRGQVVLVRLNLRNNILHSVSLNTVTVSQLRSSVGELTRFSVVLHHTRQLPREISAHSSQSLNTVSLSLQSSLTVLIRVELKIVGHISAIRRGNTVATVWGEVVVIVLVLRTQRLKLLSQILRGELVSIQLNLIGESLTREHSLTVSINTIGGVHSLTRHRNVLTVRVIGGVHKVVVHNGETVVHLLIHVTVIQRGCGDMQSVLVVQLQLRETFSGCLSDNGSDTINLVDLEQAGNILPCFVGDGHLRQVGCYGVAPRAVSVLHPTVAVTDSESVKGAVTGVSGNVLGGGLPCEDGLTFVICNLIGGDVLSRE